MVVTNPRPSIRFIVLCMEERDTRQTNGAGNAIGGRWWPGGLTAGPVHGSRPRRQRQYHRWRHLHPGRCHHRRQSRHHTHQQNARPGVNEGERYMEKELSRYER